MSSGANDLGQVCAVLPVDSNDDLVAVVFKEPRSACWAPVALTVFQIEVARQFLDNDTKPIALDTVKPATRLAVRLTASTEPSSESGKNSAVGSLRST